mmetsp:Transcript_49383/g.84891  ORF Transcript_49383/g.84891 Transcript_49383/m.84891 type:complete len:346 (-) Transcript_49383:85-1122(-)
MMGTTVTILVALCVVAGLIVFGKFCLTLFTALLQSYFLKCAEFCKYGEWAVVTGATDGIGKAYAKEMAERGLNVLLISRNMSKLQKVKLEILEAFPGVKAEVHVCDFSAFDLIARNALSLALEELNIAILINNVGIGYKFPQYFSELAHEEVINIIELNINSCTWMTRIVLPLMERKSGAQKGLIVNLSSGSSLFPCPLLSEYSAAKSYVARLSASLDAELKGKGIRVQAQAPLYVTSKLSKIRNPSLLVPTPEQYVRCAVKYIGNVAVTNPWFPHRAQVAVLTSLPSCVSERILLSMHTKTRRKALKKIAQKSKDHPSLQSSVLNPFHQHAETGSLYGSTLTAS